MNTSIAVKVVDNGWTNFPGVQALGPVYSIIVTNNGVESIHLKIPLTRYANTDNRVVIQKNWGKETNGAKGVSLLEGSFCRMDLVYGPEGLASKGDRLLINVELGKQLGSICFTFECTGGAINQKHYNSPMQTNFVLIGTTFTAPPEPASAIKSAPSMTNALKRIALLEEGLSEVLRNLDAMKRDFSKLEAWSKSGSAKTLSEVFAWLAMQDRVRTADLRARLLPLNVLTGALVNEINELAIDITGEVALEEVGNEIVVTRTTLGQILGSLDVKQFEKRVSS